LRDRGLQVRIRRERPVTALSIGVARKVDFYFGYVSALRLNVYILSAADRP
jgi:hypothetical protein